MSPLIATLIVIGLALLGARFSFSTDSAPAGPKLVFRTGTHFVFLGLLLGPRVLGLLSQNALEQLFPLMALGLGWIGFLFGMQLDRNVLLEFGARLHAFAYTQALLALALFAGGGMALLYGLDLLQPQWTVLVWAAAATACISAPAGIAMVSSNFLVRGPVRRLLFFTSSIDGLVGIVALQIIYSVFHAPRSFRSLGELPAFFWITAGTGLGILCGIVFLWLTRRKTSSEELVLYLMGTCSFAAAAALRLHVSPLYVCAVMGILVANLSPEHRRIFTAVHQWEKPLYVVLLILAGALLNFSTTVVWLFAGAYFVMRMAAKVLAAWGAASLVRMDFASPRRLGLGLMSQSGISIAMALSVLLTFYSPQDPDAPEGPLLFTIVVVGVILSELSAPYVTTRVLRRAGEISPEVVQAIARGDEGSARAAAIRHRPTPEVPGTQEEE